MGSNTRLDLDKFVFLLATEQTNVYVYLHQAADNLNDFSLWTNNSATLGKTKTFQINIFVLICRWKDMIWEWTYLEKMFQEIIWKFVLYLNLLLRGSIL